MYASRYSIGKQISFLLCPSSVHSRKEHNELRQRSQLNFQQSRNAGAGNLDFCRRVQNNLLLSQMIVDFYHGIGGGTIRDHAENPFLETNLKKDLFHVP